MLETRVSNKLYTEHMDLVFGTLCCKCATILLKWNSLIEKLHNHYVFPISFNFVGLFSQTSSYVFSPYLCIVLLCDSIARITFILDICMITHSWISIFHEFALTGHFFSKSIPKESSWRSKKHALNWTASKRNQWDISTCILVLCNFNVFSATTQNKQKQWQNIQLNLLLPAEQK